MTAQPPIDFLSSQPYELLTNIFLFLDQYDLVRLSRTCKRFKQIITQNAYAFKCTARWPALHFIAGAKKTDEEWKQIYNDGCMLESKWRGDYKKFTITDAEEKIIQIIPHRVLMSVATSTSFLHFKKVPNFEISFSGPEHSYDPSVTFHETRKPKIAVTEVQISEKLILEAFRDYREINTVNGIGSEIVKYTSESFLSPGHVPQLQSTSGTTICCTGVPNSFLFSNQDIVLKELQNAKRPGPGAYCLVSEDYYSDENKTAPFYHLTENGSFQGYQRGAPNSTYPYPKSLFQLENKAEVLQASLKGKFLVCYHADGVLAVYDIQAMTLHNKMKAITGTMIETVKNDSLLSLINDGTFILAGFASGRIAVYSLQSLKLVQKHQLPAQLTCLASDGKKWAAGTEDNEVSIRNCATGEHLQAIPLEGKPTAVSFDEFINNVLYVGIQKVVENKVVPHVDRYKFGNGDSSWDESCSASLDVLPGFS